MTESLETLIGVALVTFFVSLLFSADDGAPWRRLARAKERARRKLRYKDLIAQEEERMDRAVAAVRAMTPVTPSLADAAE